MMFYLLPMAVAAFAILVGIRLTSMNMSLLGLPVMALGIAIPLLVITIHNYNAAAGGVSGWK